MAPIGTNLADAGGAVTRQLIDWYAERAWGGVGLVIVENAMADVRFGCGLAHQLRIDDPRLTPGLSDLVEAVQASGAKIAIQINIQGAGVDPDLQPGVQPVGPSPISYVFDPSGPGSTLPARMRGTKHLRALQVEEMKELRAAFIRAAAIAQSAGFDAIEIHGAHGYLLASFMSPFSNKRDDEYGKTLEGRLRFVLEVCEGIREQVGREYPLLFRLSGREYLQGGREIRESQIIAKQLEQLGVDGLHVSAGISMQAEPYTWMNPPMAFPQGAFIEDAQAIKKAVQIPVIGVGKIRDPGFAEKLLEQEKVDFIALGRTLVADPEWAKKAMEGRDREIRRCISCNRCLRIMYRRTIRCAVNARAGVEREFPMRPASRKRRVAVIGGGPAGMEAARVAAERGHEVVLFEKERTLGGQLKLAMAPPFKRDLWGLLAYLKGQVRGKVKVKLQQEIHSQDLLNLQFDSVIVATGCAPPSPARYPQAQGINCRDILRGKAKIEGPRVAVIGKGRVACETAELLARRRKKEVIIIHSGPMEELGGDMDPLFERRLLLNRLKDCGVEILHDTAVVEITDEGVKVHSHGAGFIPCDHVVVEEVPTLNNSLLQELRGNVEVIGIGDCVEPRDLYQAIHDGFRAGYRIG